MENRCELQQFHSNKFDFAEVISFLEKFGRQQYSSRFKIYQEDHEIIFKLLSYFFQDEKICEKNNICPKKGILLSGPVGCGKTSLMSLMKHIFPPTQQHIMTSTRKITFEFIEDGFKVIQKYTNGSFRLNSNKWVPKTYCFDDLGVESQIKHYGNNCNIMAEILLSRYDLFISHGMRTHITTNLSATEIEDFYGNRVRSRMREMLNIIAYSKNSYDKRS